MLDDLQGRDLVTIRTNLLGLVWEPNAAYPANKIIVRKLLMNPGAPGAMS